MAQGFEALTEAWDRHAEVWARWTRVPGHDVYHELLNWPALQTLLPPAGRRTLDVGCGEGRAGRQLCAGGHRVAGIDSSPTLVRLMREAGGYDELVRGDAAELTWEINTFDLAVAYMSLHDMDDMSAAVGEIGAGTSARRATLPGDRAPTEPNARSAGRLLRRTPVRG